MTALAKRILLVRYRRTTLGALWVLLQPLIMMAIFTIFFGLLGRTETDGVPYAVFFLCGLVFMSTATKILTEGGMSIVANGGLISRIYLPPSSYPMSVTLASIVDLFFMFLTLIAVMLLEGVQPALTVSVVPLTIILTISTALGLAFLFGALHAEFRDLQIMLPFLTQAWFFLTPVMYSASIVPDMWLPLYYLNPLAVAVTGGRWALLGSPPPPIWAWPEALAVSLVLLSAGYLLFRSRSRTFADVL